MAFEGELEPHLNEKSFETVAPEKAIKIGEAVTDIATNSTPGDSFRSESLGISAYRRCDISELSWALERTDLSNPRQPYFDF